MDIKRFEPTPYFLVGGRPNELYIRQTENGEYILFKDYEKIQSENESLKQRIKELEKNQIVWHDANKEIPGDPGEYMTADEKGDVSWDEFSDEDNTFLSGGNIVAWAELPKYEGKNE